jgi:hypothetical protein
MDIREFLRSIYLGDRACMSLLVDSWNSELKVQVTSISRLTAGKWVAGASEELGNAFLVFEGVTSLAFDPSGYLPNDVISAIEVGDALDDRGRTEVTLYIDSVGEGGDRVEVRVKVVAERAALEPADCPGHRIRE